MNPMAIEFQLRQHGNVQAEQREENVSNWELIQQVGAPSYYWNRVTNETSYELPTNEHVPLENNTNQQMLTTATEQEISSSENDQGWLSCQNENGVVYYWNYLTNETLFSLPAHLDPNTIPPYVPETLEEEVSVHKELSEEEKLKAESNHENWVTEWDEYYQANYYRNIITETLQWDPPVCLSSAPPQSDGAESSTSIPDIVPEVPQEDTIESRDVSDQPLENTQPLQVASEGNSDLTKPVEVLDEKPTLIDIQPEILSILPELPISENPPSIISTPPPPPPPPPRKPTEQSIGPIVSNSVVVDDSPTSESAAPAPTSETQNDDSDATSSDDPKIVSPTVSPPRETSDLDRDVAPVAISSDPEIVAPTISPLQKGSEIDQHGQEEEEVPELDVDKHEPNDQRDDDVLVGDGSKPVGCTSCRIS